MNNILITGVTPIENYPAGNCKKLCEEKIINTTLCIPKVKPDIESINEIKICVDSIDYKIIKTILGAKIVIYANISIKVIYTALNSQQTVHSAEFCNQICDFVLLKDCSCCNCRQILENVFIGVEDGCVKAFDRRTVDVAVIYILCPILKCEKKREEEDTDFMNDIYCSY